MKITIDTKHDSHEDLQKVINLLQHLINQSSELQPSQESGAFSNMFGAPDSEEPKSDTPDETEPKKTDTTIITY